MLRTGPSAESLLVGAVGVLCLLGLVMVYSASSVASVQGGASSWAVVSRQALFMCLGLGLGVMASRIPVQVWRDRIAVPLMVLAVSLQLLLALDVVLRSAGGPGMPFAVSVNGATRWVGYGPFSGQPSDLLKLALILWLARLLDVRHREIGSQELLKPIIAVTLSDPVAAWRTSAPRMNSCAMVPKTNAHRAKQTPELQTRTPSATSAPATTKAKTTGYRN